MNALTTTTPNLIHRDGDRLFVTSLEISNRFEKNHQHVMEAIRNLECSEEFSRSNFRLSDYNTGRGKTYPMYQITRDGFALLVMGFTGKPAMVWKERYIAAFNQMEQVLTVSNFPVARSTARCTITRHIERQVFELFVAGQRQKQIAQSLSVSISAVNLLLSAKYQFSLAAGKPECSPALIAAVAARHLDVEREKLLEAQERITQRFLSSANNQQLAHALDGVGRQLLPLARIGGAA